MFQIFFYNLKDFSYLEIHKTLVDHLMNNSLILTPLGDCKRTDYRPHYLFNTRQNKKF